LNIYLLLGLDLSILFKLVFLFAYLVVGFWFFAFVCLFWWVFWLRILLCSLGWPETQSSCLSLPCAEIKSMYHHAQLPLCFFLFYCFSFPVFSWSVRKLFRISFYLLVFVLFWFGGRTGIWTLDLTLAKQVLIYCF
jgi:hypothetical protein